MISLITKPYIKHLLRYGNMTERLLLKRNSSYDAWVYRRLPHPAPKFDHIAADVMGAFLWWWIFVHTWYQFDHLIGEFPYPDSKKWSDSELGVPPLD